MTVEEVTDELLIQNSILAFIHNYREHKWIDQYQELLQRIESGQYSTSKVQGRGRPAKRARKKETSSSTPIKETTQTT